MGFENKNTLILSVVAGVVIGLLTGFSRFFFFIVVVIGFVEAGLHFVNLPANRASLVKWGPFALGILIGFSTLILTPADMVSAGYRWLSVLIGGVLGGVVIYIAKTDKEILSRDLLLGVGVGLVLLYFFMMVVLSFVSFT